MSSAPIVANQLDVVLRNVADGITAQRADGSLAYANDAAARLLGLSSGDELIGLQGSELTRRFVMLGEDGEPLDPGLLPNRRALASGRPEQGIVGYRLLPDGDERWSLFRSTPIRDESGSVDLVINVIHDVTAERARARGRSSSTRREPSSPRRSTSTQPSTRLPPCSCRASPTTASSTWSRTAGCARS